MKKIIIMSVLFLTLCLTGCNNSKTEMIAENIKKMELTGNLVTYKAYYHNVVEYSKSKDNIFEKDRKLFIEYTGTIKLGIDLSKVKISANGNEINVVIPMAKVIGDPDVDKDDFDEKNFIESKDGIFSNKITADDANGAFEEAQQNMKDLATNDEELLVTAQKRAKVIIEEKIKQITGLSESEMLINWEYGQ